MSTWKKLIARTMELHGESLADIESSTLTPDEMEAEFDDGYGRPEGKPFTIWTKNRVYFPSNYDGAEDVATVSRHPDGVATEHVGGG